MQCDFEIGQGIYLIQQPYELDLHNCFDFCGLEYSVEDRTITLKWRRSNGEWVAAGTPKAVYIEFREVSEFRFLPRDAEMPFSEDDCVNTFGYWTDEDWAAGIFIPAMSPNPSWLMAVSFMSGAVIAVQAVSAKAQITN